VDTIPEKLDETAISVILAGKKTVLASCWLLVRADAKKALVDDTGWLAAVALSVASGDGAPLMFSGSLPFSSELTID